MPPAKKAAAKPDEESTEVEMVDFPMPDGGVLRVPKELEDKIKHIELGGPQPVSHVSVHDALVAVMREVRSVGKEGYNTHSKYNFRGIDGVLNAVGPALRQHGVFVTSKIIDGPHYTEVTTTNNKINVGVRATVEYSFHCGGDTVSTAVAAEAWDSGDKGTSKMMSVAMRIALIQLLALPTHEKDPDVDTYERENYNHEQSIEQITNAKTAEQANAIYRRAKSAGATEEQLGEIVQAGSHLPKATDGITQTANQAAYDANGGYGA